MKDGDEVTVVIGSNAIPAVLWCGEVDNDFVRRMDVRRYSTMVHEIPAGCFLFNGVGTTCFVEEIHEHLVWVRGHVAEADPAGAALLAAWHTGTERVLSLFRDSLDISRAAPQHQPARWQPQNTSEPRSSACAKVST